MNDLSREIGWDKKSVVVARNSRCVSRLTSGLFSDSSGTPPNVDALNQLFETASAANVLKDDRTTTVIKTDRFESGVECVLKRYNARNRWHNIKRALRRSRASSCWNMSFEFKRAGLNVSEPLMMYEDRLYLLRKDAYFANRLLTGDELLAKLPTMDERGQASVKRAVLDAFHLLKESRISHGDMKATNLLWVDNELYFIDLDAAKKHAWWSLTWCKAHAKDKKRFLKNWSDKPELLSLFAELS